MRDMSGDRGYPHEKLGLKRIACASRLTFPDMSGGTTDQEGKNPDMMSSKPGQAGHTPDFASLLISSIFVPIIIPHVSFSTIIAVHKFRSSLSISEYHGHESTLSTAYTEYSIHQVQHTASTAYSES